MVTCDLTAERLTHRCGGTAFGRVMGSASRAEVADAWQKSTKVDRAANVASSSAVGAHPRRGAVRRWTMITAATGSLFALLHVREWLELIDQGMTMLKKQWGTGLFGASFFSITGLHLTHVTCGIVALIAVRCGFLQRWPL